MIASLFFTISPKETVGLSSWSSTLLYHRWLCHHLGTGTPLCNISVLSDRRNSRLSCCSLSLSWVKIKVGNIFGFLLILYILIHFFHFTNSMGWTTSADENLWSKVKKFLSASHTVHQKARVTDRNICQHMAMQMHSNTFGFDSFALDVLLSKRTNCFCFLGFSNNRPMLGIKNFRY